MSDNNEDKKAYDAVPANTVEAVVPNSAIGYEQVPGLSDDKKTDDIVASVPADFAITSGYDTVLSPPVQGYDQVPAPNPTASDDDKKNDGDVPSAPVNSAITSSYEAVIPAPLQGYDQLPAPNPTASDDKKNDGAVPSAPVNSAITSSYEAVLPAPVQGYDQVPAPNPTASDDKKNDGTVPSAPVNSAITSSYEAVIPAPVPGYDQLPAPNPTALDDYVELIESPEPVYTKPPVPEAEIDQRNIKVTALTQLSTDQKTLTFTTPSWTMEGSAASAEEQVKVDKLLDKTYADIKAAFIEKNTELKLDNNGAICRVDGQALSDKDITAFKSFYNEKGKAIADEAFKDSGFQVTQLAEFKMEALQEAQAEVKSDPDPEAAVNHLIETSSDPEVSSAAETINNDAKDFTENHATTPVNDPMADQAQVQLKTQSLSQSAEPQLDSQLSARQ